MWGGCRRMARLKFSACPHAHGGDAASCFALLTSAFAASCSAGLGHRLSSEQLHRRLNLARLYPALVRSHLLPLPCHMCALTFSLSPRPLPGPGSRVVSSIRRSSPLPRTPNPNLTEPPGPPHTHTRLQLTVTPCGTLSPPPSFAASALQSWRGAEADAKKAEKDWLKLR